MSNELKDGWKPHQPDTWKARYGTLRNGLKMSHFTGDFGENDPVMRVVDCPAGTRVKIVMVSRFGDIGITEDLSGDRGGYGCRVYFSDLDNLSMEP